MASFFSDWWKSRKRLWNRLILMTRWWLNPAIVFWLCSINCGSKHKLSKILPANVANPARFVTLNNIFIQIFNFVCVFYNYTITIHEWVTITRYSKRELSTVNMFYSLKKFVISHNGHLPTTATSFCPQGGPCREVGHMQ